ncbi:MAG: Flp pilus assembly protein CpaB [bacterium]|jgi:pilus assembly protein CpaB
MKQRIVLIVSVIVAVMAFWLTREYFQARLREIEQERERLLLSERRADVVAAKRALPEGTVLLKKDLAVKNTLAREVGKNTVLPENLDQLLGKKLRYSMDAEETLLWSYVDVPYAPGSGLAPTIKPGMRAISMSIGGAAGVSGLVQPNDRVDVLGSFSFPSRKNAQQMEWVTLTVLQDVTVLATGQTLGKQAAGAADRSRVASGYSTVTVEATPREAELLVFVENMRGHLTLSLRNPSDVTYERDLPEINFDMFEKELPELNAYRQQKIRQKGGN